MTRAQRHVDDICDCGDNDRNIFFQEPGGNTIRIRLLIKISENSHSEVGLKNKNLEELPVVKVHAEK